MKGLIFLVVVVMAFALGLELYAVNATQETLIVEVTGGERVVKSNGDSGVTSYYLVFTDSETFQNKDELLVGKFDSSDFQSKLMQKGKFRIRVCGWRIPFLSMYRNILDVEKLD